eukprot:CAMPEP_0202354176 /NCGR_PEP_ID=MMETSP1126-20121109/9616_1 /ASSEMBLY_ACC=CAM_ASM_000457 /TAXON_ID=3047 /ORGANISM="Dunaliella tertiolecta, Strain CCMP1320" /LENGTH=169 /DNA_ID=CAMNT_0048946621 /DNA_START=280 /DNA_END=790 /DNA_ORIENTATION=-
MVLFLSLSLKSGAFGFVLLVRLSNHSSGLAATNLHFSSVLHKGTWLMSTSPPAVVGALGKAWWVRALLFETLEAQEEAGMRGLDSRLVALELLPAPLGVAAARHAAVVLAEDDAVQQLLLLGALVLPEMQLLLLLLCALVPQVVQLLQGAGSPQADAVPLLLLGTRAPA